MSVLGELALPPRSLLIVEDEEALRELYQETLDIDGWRVTLALTADDVLSALPQVAGAVVDWATLGAIGLQHSPALSARPIVYVSTDPDCPIQGVVQKPFDMQRFARTVFTRCSGSNLYRDDVVVSAVTPQFGEGHIVGKTGTDTYLVSFPSVSKTLGPDPITCHRTALRFAKAPASLTQIIKGFGKG